MHLKYSNGSRQLEQRYKALQGVEANSLSFDVCVEAQRGQVTFGSRHKCFGLPTECAGGAMPYSLSLARALSVSQSLVQAGANTDSTLGSRKPSASSRDRMELAITSVAGQPVYV